MNPRKPYKSPVRGMERNVAAYHHARALVRMAVREITENVENNAVPEEVLDLYNIPKDAESLKRIHAELKRILEQL